MKETLNKLRSSLVPIYGKGEAEAIIRLIFHHLKGWNLTDMLIHSEDKLSAFLKEKIDQILQRLLQYEPIQYITREARFHGMELKIRPGVLIPRVETEELVDLIIDENRTREDLNVLDLCSGSGCIAIALQRNLPFSKVTAVDFSDIAVEIIKENALKLKSRINIIKEDIFNFIPSQKYDIIVSNPPYVLDSEALDMEKNVLDYEPHDALFVRDENPLVYYDAISDIAVASLSEGGKLYFEINPLMAERLKQLIKNKGFTDITLHRDSFGKIRFLSCCK